MQTRGCKAQKHDEVKVREWLGIEDLEKYEEYVLRWHRVIEKIADFMTKPAEPGVKSRVHEQFLKHFYETPYDTSKEFYSQIYERIDEWNSTVGSDLS
jgi:membrane-bound lytic murein transglycosylase MltF